MSNPIIASKSILLYSLISTCSSYNDIKLNMYYIQNIIETDALGNVTVHDTNAQTQTRYEFDTLTINYSDRV